MTAKSNAAKKDVSIDDLNAEIEKLREDLSGLTETIVKLGAKQSDDAISELSNRAELARANGERIARGAADTARRLGEEASHTVKESPMTALAIAAAMGAAFGYLTSRR